MKFGAQAARPRTPLTVVGGFLGAGKTTFLNRMLAEAQGPTAVLVNDFGAVNVDAGLIAEHDGKTLRLTNGCVCCSLADGFLDTMMRVLAEPFDHVVVEASGVGDPWAIAEIALVEPSLVLAAVVVLADVERLATLVSDERVGDTVRRQFRAADLLLLNKIDLVDEAKRRVALELLRTMCPRLRVVETVNAAIPLALIENHFDATALRRRALVADAAHEQTFVRLLYQRTGTFARARLEATLHALPPSILRLKGIVTIGNENAQLLQMVGGRFTLSSPPAHFEYASQVEVVGIGTRLEGDQAALDRALDDILSQETPSTT